MTETDWLTWPEPHRILQFLLDLHGKPDPRRLRLFACACVRRAWPLLADRRSREIVPLAERYAEGLTDRRQLSAALRVAQEQERIAYTAWRRLPWRSHSHREQAVRLAQAISATVLPEAINAAWEAADAVAAALQGNEHSAQSALLREIFGNPLRPPAPTSWARWGEGTLLRLAQTIYEEQRWAELQVLADALEDAGCDDPAVLEHCRGPGEHVRGCWVLDWVLGQ